jgi:hypothetical protein
MTSSGVDPAVTYRARIARFDAASAALAARGRRLGTLRVAVFLAVIAAGLWLERAGGTLPLAVLLGGVSTFIVLVVIHRRVRAAEAWQTALAQTNRQGLARLARDWDALPAAAEPPPAHPYARDLDILGRASLRQLLGATASVHGEQRLRDWLLAPSSPAELPQRQAAVRDLADRNDLRDTIAAHGASTAHGSRAAIDDVLAWAEAEPWLARLRWPYALAVLLTAVTWTLIALHALGVTGATPWLGALLANYLLTAGFYKRIHATYDRAFAREHVLEALPPLLAALGAEPYRAPLLNELRTALDSNGTPPHRELRRLVRMMELSDVRRSTFTYLPVQLFTLWDFHLLTALERWQRTAGRRLRGWLETAGTMEAIAALAALAHDHPDWTYPNVDPALDSYAARGLGHPLLDDDARVANDLSIGPPGTFLFVTGSNMSGKSTLLRAIGVNAVLAQAGAPACAHALGMPPLDVWTSVRIDDSLVEGVSLFMAELRRMKEIVDAAHVVERSERRPLFLLDEMLHGTNTAERRIAARRIIRHLLEHGAIGAVTTHDLALADDDELRAAAVCVHFTETVHGEGEAAPMTFDYRLRPGLATSTNALRLMELIGLGEARGR